MPFLMDNPQSMMGNAQNFVPSHHLDHQSDVLFYLLAMSNFH